MIIVNTRADLDALKGTPDHLDALRLLAGTMTATVDVVVYPDGYGGPGYAGPEIAPEWHEIETLAALERLGFTRESFEAERAAAQAAADADGG